MHYLRTLCHPKITLLPLLILMVASIASASVDIESYGKMLNRGDFGGIAKALKVIDKDTFTPKLYQIYVASLLNIDLDDAEEVAQEAIEKFDNNADMYLMHANVMGQQAQDSIFSALGYAEKALNSLEKAVQLQPNDPKYLQGLMSFHLAAPSIAGGDTDLAFELAKQINSLNEVMGVLAFTRYYKSTNEDDKAYANIESGIKKFPNDIELQSQLASLYVRDKQYEKAIEAYLRAVSLTLNEPSLEELSLEKNKTKYERDLFASYNSHYQIGRIALEANIHLVNGIKNLDKYIILYSTSGIDINGLPSTDWAYLRKAGLLLANNQAVQANDALNLIKAKENDEMQKIYKKLKKQITKSIKRKL